MCACNGLEVAANFARALVLLVDICGISYYKRSYPRLSNMDNNGVSE